MARSIFGQPQKNASEAESPKKETRAHISQLIPGWLNRLSIEQQKQKTVDEYTSKVKLFAKHVKQTPICEIKSKHVADFILQLANGSITKAPVGAGGISRYITAINSFFNYAQLEGEWPKDKLFLTHKQRIKRT